MRPRARAARQRASLARSLSRIRRAGAIAPRTRGGSPPRACLPGDGATSAPSGAVGGELACASLGRSPRGARRRGARRRGAKRARAPVSLSLRRRPHSSRARACPSGSSRWARARAWLGTARRRLRPAWRSARRSVMGVCECARSVRGRARGSVSIATARRLRRACARARCVVPFPFTPVPAVPAPSRRRAAASLVAC